MKISRFMNPWNRGYKSFGSARYGEVFCTEMKEGIRGEYISLGNNLQIMSDRPLVSPVFSDVFLNRFFCATSFEAIYPFGHEYMSSYSLHGADSQPDAVARVQPMNIYKAFLFVVNYLKTQTPTGYAESYSSAFYMLLGFLSMLGRGGLCKQLHLDLNVRGRIDGDDSTLYDYVEYLYDFIVHIKGMSVSSYLNSNNPDNASALLDYFYSSPLITKNPGAYVSRLFLPFFEGFKTSLDFELVSDTPVTEVNLGPLFGLKLIESEFFTSDAVDDIFSADRLRQTTLLGCQKYLTRAPFSAKVSYIYENASVFYDWSSGNYWNTFFAKIPSAIVSANALDPNLISFVPYFCLLTFPIFSLKFGDMYVGSRLNPLAVGPGDSVSLTPDGNVDTMAMHRGLLYLRLRQAMNRVGAKFRDQWRELFGIAPSSDPRTPKYLGFDRNLMGKDLVVSVADTQNLVTNGGSELGRYASTMSIEPNQSKLHDFLCDDQCYFYTLNYTSVKSVYPNATDPTFFKFDKLDYFNPMLQNFGDQSIRTRQFDSLMEGGNELSVFAYSPIYTEYRESVNQMSGAFGVDKHLSSWLHIPSLLDGRGLPAEHLDSHFLRIMPSSFNAMYRQTTTYGAYGYHFLWASDNIIDSWSPVTKYPDLV